MERRINKKFLEEKIKADEYFDDYVVGLLLKYGFEFDKKKKYYTQSEINETSELIKKLQEIETWHSEYLTYKQCGLLIKYGCYNYLRAFLINGFTSMEYSALKVKLNEIYAEMGKEIKQKEAIVRKPKKEKPQVNEKKVTAVCQFIQTSGGLNKKELQALASKLGYKVEGELVETEVDNSFVC